MILSTSSDVALWLGIYATLLSTTVALLALYGTLFLRVGITALEGYAVPNVHEPEQGKTFFDRDLAGLERYLDNEGFLPRAKPIIVIRVWNRGRRNVQIHALWWWSWRAPYYIHHFQEALASLPLEIPADTFGEVVFGLAQPYEHGSLANGRFAARDGAWRIHPVRERLLFRLGPRRASIVRAEQERRAATNLRRKTRQNARIQQVERSNDRDDVLEVDTAPDEPRNE